jgi:hypothetical protein
MRVPPDIKKRMLEFLPTSRDVRLWWDSPKQFLNGKTPHEQYLSDEEPVFDLIKSYSSKE